VVFSGVRGIESSHDPKAGKNREIGANIEHYPGRG
jgi:hypothetical protein